MNSTLSDEEPPQADLAATFFYINWVLTPLSLASASFMFYHCIKSTPILLSLKFIAFLALSDIFYTFSNTFSLLYPKDFYRDPASFLCKAEGVINSFFYILSIFIATSFAYLYYRTSQLDVTFNQVQFFPKVIVVGLLSSTFFSLAYFVVPVIVIETDGFTCFENYSGEDLAGNIIYHIYSNFPVYVAPFASLVFFYVGIKRLRESDIGALNSIKALPLYTYSIVLCIMLLPNLMLTLLGAIGVKDPWFLYIIEFFCMRSIGLVNAVLYGIQRRLYWSDERDQRVSVPMTMSCLSIEDLQRPSKCLSTCFDGRPSSGRSVVVQNECL